MTGRGTTTTAERRRAPRSPDDVLDEHGARGARPTMRGSVGTGVRWMGSAQVAVQVIRIVVTIVLTRLLDPADFGLVALVTVVTGLFERVLGDTGTTTAVVQQPRLSHGLASSVLYWNMCVGGATTLMFLLAGGVIAGLLGESSAGDVVRVLGIMALVNGAVYVPHALFRRTLQFRRLAAVLLTNAIVTGGATIIFAALGWGVWALVLGTLSGSVADLLLSWVLTTWRPALYFSRRALREIAGFSANLSVQNLFGYVSYAGDRFIIGRFIGTTELGYYGLANRLMRYPIQTTAQTYREVVFPTLARIQDDFAAMATAYRRSVNGIAFVIFPICATAAAVATPLVPAALGEKWSPASNVLALVAVTSGLQGVALTTGSLYNSRGRADLSLRWQIFSSVFLLVSYVIGSRWGLSGVAWGYLVGTALLFVPAFAIPLRLIGARVTTVLRGPAVSALAAAVSALAAYVVVRVEGAQGVDDRIRAATGVLVSFAAYAVYALVFRPQALRDLVALVRGRGSRRDSEPVAEPSVAGETS